MHLSRVKTDNPAVRIFDRELRFARDPRNSFFVVVANISWAIYSILVYFRYFVV